MDGLPVENALDLSPRTPTQKYGIDDKRDNVPSVIDAAENLLKCCAEKALVVLRSNAWAAWAMVQQLRHIDCHGRTTS